MKKIYVKPSLILNDVEINEVLMTSVLNAIDPDQAMGQTDFGSLFGGLFK